MKIDPSTYARAFQIWQHKAVTEALARRDSTGKLAQKVHMFNLIKEGLKDDETSHQIYDHEKTLLIDDELALVGSAGVESAGFTNDAELSIAIESSGFVTELRRRMFAEYLLLKPEDPVLATPDSSHDEFLRQANMGTRRVRHFTPAGNLTVEERALAEAIYGFAEPDGRCTEGKMRLQWQAVLDAGTDRVKEDLHQMRQRSEVLV
jgi:phosphatidylserine/phosphatidylglycerophosphate/cardiolipin synthase-like enzyme